jgi:hypothetical protein
VPRFLNAMAIVVSAVGHQSNSKPTTSSLSLTSLSFHMKFQRAGRCVSPAIAKPRPGAMARTLMQKDKPTTHQIVLRHLRSVYPRWVPAHELVKLETEWGFTGIDGDRRARELATNDARVRSEWHNCVQRADGTDIGEDKRFTYFRFVPSAHKPLTMEEFWDSLPASRVNEVVN